MKTEITFLIQARLNIEDKDKEIDEDVKIDDGIIITLDWMKEILDKVDDVDLREDIEMKISQLRAIQDLIDREN
jgi:hypothetical protein